MSVNHYENFPVASVLLPQHLRWPVQVIYQFARQADDFADEGECSDAERLQQLNLFRLELQRITAHEIPLTPLFIDLAQVIQQYQLPIPLFHDLLDAFAQDVVKKRYADFDELTNYCRRSANPVGRLMLHLYAQVTPQNLHYSDAICTSLQLINFWQDVAKDRAIGRIYLPQADMARFGVTEAQLASGKQNDTWQNLMRFQIERARELMLSGQPLGKVLTGRIGLEMRLIMAGGLRILHKIEQRNYDVFQRRPTLQTLDWGIILLKNLI